MATQDGNQEKVERESYTDEFSDFPKLFERPTFYEVLTQLVPINASWHSIGNGLGLSDNYLQFIAKSNISNKIRLDAVIQTWLDMNGKDGCAPVTWTTILDVIKGPLVENNALAREIYEYLKLESSVQSDSEKIEQTSEANVISDLPVIGGNQEKTIGKQSYTDEFSHFPKLSERPTRFEVLTQLASTDALWLRIGEGLGVSYGFLQAMSIANLSNQVILDHVIEKWLELDGQGGGAPVTWNTIIDVIKGPLVQRKDLAMKIYEYLKQEILIQKSGSNQEKIIGRESYTDEFSYFPKLSETPTRLEVLVQLAPINELWRSIGNGLGLSYNDLQVLAKTRMSNQTRLDHVVERWYTMYGHHGGTPVTWNTIIDVIKGPLVQRKDLAMEIYEYLKQESSKQQSGSNQAKTKGRESYTDEFSYFPKLSETPTKDEVLTQLACIDELWRSIGNGLGLRYNTLECLALDKTLNKTRLDNVIEMWLNMKDECGDTPVTWNTIINVIKGPLVQRKDLAMKIYEYLKQEILRQLSDAKKITFDENDLIGIGSKGTFVYKGSFGSINVAVKRVVSEQFNELVKGEIEVLQEHDWHPNIVRFYSMEEDNGFVNIALELCHCTLYEFVEGNKLQHANGKALLLGAMAGVDHLHKFNIIHRDLKPKNILLKLTPHPSNEVIAVISDFGLCRELAADQTHMTTVHGMAGTLGWIAPEMSEDISKVTQAVDIFAMGCIIYYVLSRGKHPFGSGEYPFNAIMCQAKIWEKNDGNLTLTDLEGEDKFTAENLVRTMTKSNHESRPFSGEVLAHCLFWSKDRQLKFFQEVSDWIQWALKNKPSGSTTIVDDLEVGVENVFKNEWLDSIDEELKQELKKYQGTLLRELLRAIRNKSHHHYDLGEPLKTKLGPIPEGFVTYFTSRFPCLLSHTYNVMNWLFWSKDKELKFFQQVSDWIQGALIKQPPESTTVDNLEVGLENVFENEWIDSIDEELKQDFKEYQGTLVRELLRGIRNKSHHYYDLPKSLKTKLGLIPEDFVTYFTSRFPFLLSHTYYVMKREANFKEHHPDFF